MISYDLDMFLFSDKLFWKMETILSKTGLSQKEFQNIIDEFNHNFQKQGLHPLEIKDNILAIPQIPQSFEETRFGIPNPYTISIHREERDSLIYLLIFSEIQFLNVITLQNLLKVSRNTIFSDIKKLRTRLETKNIKLQNSRKQGFYFEGDELNLRQEAYVALQKIHEPEGYYILSKFINQRNPNHISQIYYRLRKLLSMLEIHIVYSRFLPILFFTNLLLSRFPQQKIEKFPHLINEEKFDKLLDEFYDQEDNQAENDYLLSLLIGTSDGQFHHKNLDFLYRIGFQIMENVMKLTAIEYDNFTKTFNALLAHLIPAYFRLRNHFHLENSLLEQIKYEYLEFFDIIKKSIEPLEKICGEIPEEELAYFVVLFSGEIEGKHRRRMIRAIVLCVNGISSSFIMRKCLEDLFPDMEFILTASITQLDEIPINSYDIIFSNLQIISEKKTYLMSPMPDEKEKKKLYNLVCHDFSILEPVIFSAESIISLIEPYLKPNVDVKKIAQLIEYKINK